MLLCAPGLVCFPFTTFSSLFCKTSTTNDDFPEPETPVTTVKIPSGKLTSSFFKLYAVAPETESKYFSQADVVNGELINKKEHYTCKENNQNFLVTFLTDPKWEQTATMLFITILENL